MSDRVESELYQSILKLENKLARAEAETDRLRGLLKKIYAVPNLNLGDDDLVCELDHECYRTHDE